MLQSWSSCWWHDDPPKDPIEGRQWPPNGPIGREPAPHLQPLTTYFSLWHLTTLLPSTWEFRVKVCYVCIYCWWHAFPAQKKVFRNWPLPQWWLPQGLEFLNFPYWLLQGVLTLRSDLSTGGLCQPKAVLKFCPTIGTCGIAGNFYVQSRLKVLYITRSTNSLLNQSFSDCSSTLQLDHHFNQEWAMFCHIWIDS